MSSSLRDGRPPRGRAGWEWPSRSACRPGCPGSPAASWRCWFSRPAAPRSGGTYSCEAHVACESWNGPRTKRALAGYRWASPAAVCRPAPTTAAGTERASGYSVFRPVKAWSGLWWTPDARIRVQSGALAGDSSAFRTMLEGPLGPPGRGELITCPARFEVHHVSFKIIRLAPPWDETFGGVQGLFSSQGAGVLL